VRFVWSARTFTDAVNTWLRDTMIAACADHVTDVTRQLNDAAIPPKS